MMRDVADSSPVAQVMVSSDSPCKSPSPPYPFQRPIGSMKSMPAASPICASARHSSQLADHRSGTSVAARPDEQLAPNRPSLSLLALYISRRSHCDTTGRLSKGFTPYVCAGSSAKRPTATSLLRFDIGIPDDPAPDRGLFLEELRHLGRRTPHRIELQLPESGIDRRLAEQLRQV